MHLIPFVDSDCGFFWGGLVVARLCCNHQSEESCEFQWDCVPVPFNKCCFSFVSPAPMEVLNKHYRVLLYVENYRQIRSAGKSQNRLFHSNRSFFLPVKPSFVSLFSLLGVSLSSRWVLLWSEWSTHQPFCRYKQHWQECILFMFAATLFAWSFLMPGLEFSRGRKAGPLLSDWVQGQWYLQWLLWEAVAVKEAPTLIPQHCLPMAWMADARGCPM